MISEERVILIYTFLYRLPDYIFFPQNTKIEIKFSIDAAHPVADTTIGYAILLTKKLVSISSVGRRHSDLI